MKAKRLLALLIAVAVVPQLAGAQTSDAPFVSAQDAQYRLSTSSVNPQEDSVAFAEMRRRMSFIRKNQNRPTVAVVLSGGGAKGAAHVGVLKYLEEQEIPIDMVLGTSMGGLVGGLYSMGYDAEYLDSLLTSVDWNMMLSDKIPHNYLSYATRKYRSKYVLAVPFHYSKEVFNMMTGQDQEKKRGKKSKEEEDLDIPINNIARSLPAGYINGLNVNKVFRSMTAGYQDSISFAKLPIPFCCVASDMVSCEAKNWTSGSVNDAMRSTMSIPGLFDPVRTNGMVLVDGGTRNNFPTDIARAMGADYVIGVELSDEDKTYDDINNIGDILWTFIEMLGREAFSKNVGNTDIFIKPNLKGYNMLSFSSENIEDIIERGYIAAAQQNFALKQLKTMMPNAVTRLQSPPAKDINRTPLQIRSIEFEGMKNYESKYLAGKLEFMAGDVISADDLEHAVSLIYATGAFESVTFKLLGSEEPYRLVFKCDKRPIHQFGFGYRADNETLVDVIVNVGLNAHKIAGPKLDLTGKLGQNSYAEAHFSVDMPKTPTLNAAARINGYSANVTYNDVDYRLKYWSHTEEAYISNMHWKRADIRAGARREFFDITNWLSNGVQAVDNNTLSTFGGAFYSAFFDANIHTLDDFYFPEKGSDLDFSYKWVWRKDGVEDFADEHIASINMKKVIGIGSRVALIGDVYARALIADDEVGLTNLPLKNCLGGNMQGRYLEQQMPFVGFNDMLIVGDWLASAEAVLRFRFGKNLFTSFEGGYFRTASNLGNFLGAESMSCLGAGFQIAYRTIVGPLKADFCWSDRTNKVGFYLSFGYDF